MQTSQVTVHIYLSGKHGATFLSSSAGEIPDTGSTVTLLRFLSAKRGFPVSGEAGKGAKQHLAWTADSYWLKRMQH